MKTPMSPRKRMVTNVSSTEAETERTEDFLFLLSPSRLPLSFCHLRRRENRTQRRRKQKEKNLIFVFALPSLLCLHLARFPGDITDTKAFPLALPFLTSLVKSRLNSCYKSLPCLTGIYSGLLSLSDTWGTSTFVFPSKVCCSLFLSFYFGGINFLKNVVWASLSPKRTQMPSSKNPTF